MAQARRFIGHCLVSLVPWCVVGGWRGPTEAACTACLHPKSFDRFVCSAGGRSSTYEYSFASYEYMRPANRDTTRGVGVGFFVVQADFYRY